MTDEEQLTAWNKHRRFLIQSFSGVTDDERNRWGVKFQDALKNAESQIEKLEKELKDPPKVVQ